MGHDFSSDPHISAKEYPDVDKTGLSETSPFVLLLGSKCRSQPSKDGTCVILSPKDHTSIS